MSEITASRNANGSFRVSAFAAGSGVNLLSSLFSWAASAAP
jgi:hypothetical protein